MGEMDDLVKVDFWASKAFNPDLPDEELRHWFKEFSLRADKMLLDKWKHHNDDRMTEVKQILWDMIYEKEHPPAGPISCRPTCISTVWDGTSPRPSWITRTRASP